MKTMTESKTDSNPSEIPNSSNYPVIPDSSSEMPTMSMELTDYKYRSSKVKIPSDDPFDNKIGCGLSKGKYDIDFAIGLCNNVIKHCEQHVLQAGNFGISLKHSLRKMISFLQQEKQGKQHDPVILWTCDKCKESEPIFVSRAKDHQCNFCQMKKPQLLRSFKVEDKNND